MVVSLDEEIRRNPELSRVDIESLREWVQKQPHLPEVTDSELALFLHSNYYRIEPTKKTIDTYFTVRSHVPDFFTSRDIDEDKDLARSITVAIDMPLEGKTKDGYQVFFGTLIDYEPSKYDYTVNMKLLTMVIDVWLRDKGTYKGHVMIVDLKGLALGHVARCSPMAFKHFFYYLQEGLPVRLKGVHFINANPVMDLIMNIMKPFMKKELLEIVHMHQKPEEIEAFNIPLEVLPNEAGGKAGPLKEIFGDQVRKLRESKQWFEHDEKNRRVDESKRPEHAKSEAHYFGAEGSFKKLEFD